MSVKTEFSWLSDDHDRFMPDASVENQPMFSMRQDAARNLKNYAYLDNPINRYIMPTFGVVPWKSRLGRDPLPTGYSLAIQRLDVHPDIIILKILLDVEARHRLYAVLFAIFGNTEKTCEMIKAFLGHPIRHDYSNSYTDKQLLRNYAMRDFPISMVCNPNTEYPKVNDQQNVPPIWYTPIPKGFGALQIGIANMCVRDLESEDLFTKAMACEMRPDLAEEILSNIPKYMKGTVKDKLCRLQTQLYYNLLRTAYDIETTPLNVSEVAKLRTPAEIRCIISQMENAINGCLDRTGMLVESITEASSADSLQRWYQKLRASLLVCNTNSEDPYVNNRAIIGVVGKLAPLLFTGNAEENRLLVDYISAVVEENRLDESLRKWMRGTPVINTGNEFASNGLLDVEISAQTLANVSDALESLKAKWTNRESVQATIREYRDFLRSRCRNEIMHPITSYTVTEYNRSGLLNVIMLALISNKFHMVTNTMGINDYKFTRLIRGSKWIYEVPYSIRHDNSEFPHSKEQINDWDEMQELASDVNGVSGLDSKLEAVFRRILTVDLEHFYRVNSTKGEAEMFELARTYNNPYENIENDAISGVEEYATAYAHWYIERFSI